MTYSSEQIDFFKDIVKNQYSILIKNDYGEEGLEKLSLLTNNITKLYSYLNYNLFDEIIIFTGVERDISLESIQGANPVRYQSYQNLGQLSGTTLTIEVVNDLKLLVSIDYLPDKEFLREKAIVYYRYNHHEIILGKSENKPLERIPNADSYFAVPMYKNLDEALEDYKIKVARISKCEYLKKVWNDVNKIYFKSGPESFLRDSLYYFLYIRIRDAEVRPEQNVDTSHPVDIKITWTLTNRIAIIEIKWLGKSLNSEKRKITASYSETRAIEGAEQLKNYLEQNRNYSPDKITMGYLVVFDGRRNMKNGIKERISKSEGFYYANREIIYTPEYNKLRNDFAKPIKLFMEPICID